MSWTERKSTSDLTVLGDDEGHVRKVGGLLAAVRQDARYPSRQNYALIQRNGTELWLAGSASLSNQIGPADVGKFIKARFEGWGQSPNGKFKVIIVSVYEGEPTPEMLAWPQYREVQQSLRAAPRVDGARPKAMDGAKPKIDVDDYPEPLDDEDDEFPV